jgi:hypothetical protein
MLGPDIHKGLVEDIAKCYTHRSCGMQKEKEEIGVYILRALVLQEEK